MTEEQQKAKRDEMEQEERVKKGQRRRLFSGKDAPNAGKIQISRTGAVYKVLANGSMKRLSPKETKAIYDELAANPVQKECGSTLHFFYCTACGVSRNEPCRKKEEYLR